MILILILSLTIILAGIIERVIHFQNIRAIPLRIHVNGTRGKSSTTRLIAGALREAGYRVIAKTTGTAPRLITVDGTELVIKRRGVPRIIEQKMVAALARKEKAEALVVECMAIKPEMQWTAEKQLLETNIGLITNVRYDHLGDMGAELDDIARAMALTIPRNGQLVTADERYFDYFTEEAGRVGTSVYLVEQQSISEKLLNRFSYPVFAENVACSLKVCSLLGITADVALQGMIKAFPDPGVSRIYYLKRKDKHYYLINAFAANDFVSTMMVWENYSRRLNQECQGLQVIGVFNNRSDRLSRIEDLKRVLKKIDFQQLYLMGDLVGLVRRQLLKKGCNKEIRLLKGYILENNKFEKIFKQLEDINSREVLLFGFGNIKGPGLKLVEYFRENGEVF